LHLLVIYLQEAFRHQTIQNAPKSWRVSWIALDQNHPMRFFQPVQLTEPLDGPDGEFLRGIIDDRPDLLLVELAPPNTPSHHVIHILKTSAATRRIPLLAVGASPSDLRAARQSGADQAVAQDDWQAIAADVLAGWTARLDSDELVTACAGSLHPLAAQGVEAVNQGRYFLAHELLEEAWMDVDQAEGTLYRGLLQVSVAYLHLERHNLAGALKMLLRMRQWLDPLPDTCRGIDVKQLRRLMASLRDTLEALDWSQSARIQPQWYQPIPLAAFTPKANDDNSIEGS
jgi:hypothetical protein